MQRMFYRKRKRGPFDVEVLQDASWSQASLHCCIDVRQGLIGWVVDSKQVSGCGVRAGVRAGGRGMGSGQGAIPVAHHQARHHTCR